MDAIFARLACCLLALSVAQPGKGHSTITPTTTNSDLSPLTNLTHTTAMGTSSNSAADIAVISNLTGNTTPFTSVTQDNETFTKTTAAPAESTSHLQTTQSTPIMTPLTNSTPLITPQPYNSTFTAMTPAMQTTVGHISTSDTSVIMTNSPLAVNTSSDSLYRTTQALQLNISEKNMTILFSVVLGVLAMALVVFMFHKCKQKTQFLHQPLNNSDDMDAFVADDDTLVISGGLYDGHPICDNAPTASADQSQLRLEFLH